MTADAAKTTSKITKTSAAKTSYALVLGCAVIALVIALVACGGSGYLFWQGKQLQQSSLSMQTQLAAAQTQANNLKQSLLTMQTKEQAQIKQALLQMHQDKDTAASTIKLGSAVYLARLANLALMINHDPNQAEHLLDLAQMRLKDVASYTALRAAVIHVREQLIAVPTLDLDGILMQLGGLKEVVMTMQAASPIIPITAKPAVNNQGIHLSANWQTLWQWLKQFVIITHHDSDHAVLPTIAHMQTVKDSVYLALSTAQWAALHQKPAIYEHALEGAQLQLKTIIQARPKVVHHLLQRIAQLQAISIKPAYPSLDALMAQLTAMQTGASQSGSSNTTETEHAQLSQMTHAPVASVTPPKKPTPKQAPSVQKQKVTLPKAVQGVVA